MKQRLTFDPAWDHGEKGGVHGVEITFGLIGPAGAVQFKLATNWMLPHVQKKTDASCVSRGVDEITLRAIYHPLPIDLGYHSPIKMYDGQEPLTQACEWLDGRPCYYDGSGLNAQDVYKILLREGDAGVWKHLREYYDRTFSRETAHERAADEAFT